MNAERGKHEKHRKKDETATPASYSNFTLE